MHKRTSNTRGVFPTHPADKHGVSRFRGGRASAGSGRPCISEMKRSNWLDVSGRMRQKIAGYLPGEPSQDPSPSPSSPLPRTALPLLHVSLPLPRILSPLSHVSSPPSQILSPLPRTSSPLPRTSSPLPRISSPLPHSSLSQLYTDLSPTVQTRERPPPPTSEKLLPS